MFNLFPQLLFLQFAATGLLRVTAGCYLLYIGYYLWQERAVVAKERYPIVGRMPEWVFACASMAQMALGLLLIVGAWTQLVALLGAIVAFKCLVFGKEYKKIMPIERSTSLLLLIVLLVLVVSGAGAFAFDLPL